MKSVLVFLFAIIAMAAPQRDLNNPDPAFYRPSYPPGTAVPDISPAWVNPPVNQDQYPGQYPYPGQQPYPGQPPYPGQHPYPGQPPYPGQQPYPGPYPGQQYPGQYPGGSYPGQAVPYPERQNDHPWLRSGNNQ